MQRIAQIENAMVTALRAAAAAASFRVDTIESYGGQLDDDLLEWVRRLPAIWVVFSGLGKPKAVDASLTRWRYSATFTVFCAQRNLGGNQALRQGDARNPGVYALMQLVTSVLLRRDLGLPIAEFNPGEVRTIVSTVVGHDGVMAYGMNWETAWIETLQPTELTPEGWLDSIGLKYFLKPGDNVADAADEITTAR